MLNQFNLKRRSWTRSAEAPTNSSESPFGDRPNVSNGFFIGLRRRVRRGIICLMLMILCACEEQIVHNLAEHEANTLLTRLHDVQIDAEKIKQPDGKWAISVSKGESLKAIKYLSDARILRDYQTSQIEKPSMIASREDQRFRFERSLSREIESTLSSISGVLEARVHLNLPQRDPLFGQRIDSTPGSASVLLIAEKATEISEAQVASLVSGASGVESNKISVLVSEARGLDILPSASTIEIPRVEGSPKALAEISDAARDIKVESVPENGQTLYPWIGSIWQKRTFLIKAAISFFLLGFGCIYFVLIPRRNRSALWNLKTESGVKQ